MKNIKSVNLPVGTKPKPVYGLPSYTPVVLCEHIRDAVPVGEHEVWASRYISVDDPYLEPRPDLGVYLADSWEKFFTEVKLFGGVKLKGLSQLVPYPAVVVDFSDGGTPPLDLTTALINLVRERLVKKQNVDIGCLGGHGRTGTFIACLIGVVEGLNARESITEVRLRYCKKAVETRAQINFIAEFLGDNIASVKDIIGSHTFLTTHTRYRYDYAKQKMIEEKVDDLSQDIPYFSSYTP